MGARKGGSRARPENNTKLEILKLLDAKVSQVEIEDRFGSSERFARTVKADRKKVEAATAAGGGTQKTARRGDFPEVTFLFPAFFFIIVSTPVRCSLAFFCRPCFFLFVVLHLYFSLLRDVSFILSIVSLSRSSHICMSASILLSFLCG